MHLSIRNCRGRGRIRRLDHSEGLMIRLMIRLKSKSVILLAGLVLAGASTAHAQGATLRPEDIGGFLTLSGGAQTQKRSFTSSGTFTSFNEVGRYQVAQNVG